MRLFFATSIILASILLPVATNAANDFTVTKTEDTADGTCDSDCSLREAVIASNAAGGSNSIILPAQTYRLDGLTTAGENAAASGDLDITSDITITGVGASSTIIDGNDTDRIFEVRSGAGLYLNELTVTNGNITGSAGGIQCSSGTLELFEVVVSYNTASNAAGGISTSNCSLNITNSTINNNTAVSDGGGMSVSIATGNTITVTDSSFINNTSNSLGGGISLNQINGSQFSVFDRVTFSGNSSTGGGTTGGGALEIYARVYITNSTFIDNHSDTNGGAIEAPNNTVTQLVIAQSTIVQNTAGTGGGVYVGGSNADVQIQSSIVAANTASTSGADCFAPAGLTSGNYNFFGSVSSCTFTPQAEDDTTSGAQSYMATVALDDNGGEIETLNMWGVQTLDIIPPDFCFDAAGENLTTDARGMTRPQNGNCDRGAFEKDQTDPTVSIVSGIDTIECGVDTWVDAGATVADNFSTGLTAATSDTINTDIVGLQTITYTSTPDGAYNTGTNTRTVTVVDTTAPTITLSGSASVQLKQNASYTDAGAAASDICDSSVSVSTSGSVNTSTPGTYTLTYSASDDSSNAAIQKTRTVTVVAPVPIVTINGKYLKAIIDGDVVDRIQVHRKKIPKKYRKLKQVQLYDGYTTVILLTAKKSHATLTVVRLTDEHTFKKKVVKKIPITKRNKLKIRVNIDKHAIIAQVGKGKNRVTEKFRLTKNGALNEKFKVPLILEVF